VPLVALVVVVSVAVFVNYVDTDTINKSARIRRCTRPTHISRGGLMNYSLTSVTSQSCIYDARKSRRRCELCSDEENWRYAAFIFNVLAFCSTTRLQALQLTSTKL